jgi:S1-C subfamily serine protease
MNEPSVSRSERWRGRLQKLRAGVRRGAPFASGVLATLLALLLYNILVPAPHQLTTREVNDTVAAALASATPLPAFSERAYQMVQPSIVLIQTQSTNEDGKADYGLGSGVIVNDGGDILTALHVVAHATGIKLTFADGTESSAQITVSQPEIDIAVLHPDILPALLVPAILGNPNAMQVGDEAFVVGNPFGLYSSMSAGVISGFNRTFQPTSGSQKLEGLIQIDAAVNPGNSGGPLINRDGQVVGIIEGIVNPTEENFFVGIGFAVPINVAVRAVGSPPY